MYISIKFEYTLNITSLMVIQGNTKTKIADSYQNAINLHVWLHRLQV